VTRLWCGEIYNDRCIANFLASMSVKQFWKLVTIWRSCGKISRVYFFGSRCISSAIHEILPIAY